MTAIQAINGDLTQRVAMHASTMEWQTSPSGTVWRKRLHLVGSAEARQVTSMVRYEPNSTFPAHDRPEGEEILVLEGTFSDELCLIPKDSAVNLRRYDLRTIVAAQVHLAIKKKAGAGA